MGGIVRVATPAPLLTDGQTALDVLDQIGRLRVGMEPGSFNTQIANSGSQAAGAMSIGLSGNGAGKTQYLAGFMVNGLGATAASVITIAITGLLGGTMNIPYSVPAGVTVPAPVLVQTFPTPLAASGISQIVLGIPSFGAGNTNAFGYIWGYLL